MNFSQNNEQEIILDYFKNQPTGTFLDIGANDGETLSNTRALALYGWNGVCIEPMPEAFSKLETLYTDSPFIECHNIAIGRKSGMADFYQSGTHLNKGDSGLLSTLDPNEIKRWQGTEDFEKIQVKCLCWNDFYNTKRHFDFISIDAEGLDLYILKQMDLRVMQTKLVCVEWNHNAQTKAAFHLILKRAKMRLIHMNFENLIYGL
jgi:FkbM family methyltransferase